MIFFSRTNVDEVFEIKLNLLKFDFVTSLKVNIDKSTLHAFTPFLTLHGTGVNQTNLLQVVFQALFNVSKLFVSQWKMTQKFAFGKTFGEQISLFVLSTQIFIAFLRIKDIPISHVSNHYHSSSWNFDFHRNLSNQDVLCIKVRRNLVRTSSSSTALRQDYYGNRSSCCLELYGCCKP